MTRPRYANVTKTVTMTVEQAQALGQRVLAALDAEPPPHDRDSLAQYLRAQVEADLAGLLRHQPRWYTDEEPGFGMWLRDHACPDPEPGWPCADASERIASLSRTADLCGVPA